MRPLSIISLTSILVVVYGSKLDAQGRDITESNVSERFQIALSENRASEFVGDLLSHRQYGLLRIIGEDAYRQICISEQLMDTLVDADDPELIRDAFNSPLHMQGKIVEHMVALKGLAYTLKTIGKDLYIRILVDEQSMKALVDTDDPELVREVFNVQYFRRSEIIRYLLSLKGLVYTLETIGKDSCITYFPVDEQSVEVLVDADDPELVREVFKSRDSWRSKIIKYMISLKGLSYTLETIGEDKCKEHFPVDEKSITALIDADDPELIRGVFNSRHFERSKVIKRMLLLKGLAYTLETLGKDLYKKIPINERFMKALVDTNDPGLIREIFESQCSEKSEVIEHIISLKGLAYTLETIGKDDCITYFPVDEQSVKALVDADDPELIREVFKSRHSWKSEIIDYMISLKGLSYTLETIGKDECMTHFPVGEQSMRALVGADDPELVRGVFRSRSLERSEIIGHIISLKGLVYTLQTIRKDAYRWISIDEQSTEALVNTNDPELIREFFKSRSSGKSEIIRHMISIKGLAYTLETIGKGKCKKHFPIDEQSTKALVNTNDPELIREFFKSWNSKNSEIIRCMILLKGLAYTLETIGRDDCMTHFPVDEQSTKALVDADDPELIEGIFMSLCFGKDKIIKHMISLKGLAYTLDTIGKDELVWYFPIDKQSIEFLVDANDPELVKEVFESQCSKRSEIIEHMISLKGLAYTLETIGKDKCKNHFPVDEQSMRALVNADDPELVRGVFKSRDSERSKIIEHMISLKGLVYTLETIGKDLYKEIPINDRFMKALAEADDPELIREFFKLQYSKQNKIIKHMVSLKGPIYTLEVIGKDACPWIRIDKQSMEVLVDANDPELVREVFKSQDHERSKIIKYMISLKGLVYALETIGKDLYKKIPINERFIKVLVEADDPEPIREIFNSRTKKSRRIIFESLKELRGLAYALTTLRAGVLPYVHMNEGFVLALIDAKDNDLAAEIFKVLTQRRKEAFLRLLSNLSSSNNDCLIISKLVRK